MTGHKEMEAVDFPDQVTGDHNGVDFPVSYDVLQSGGADELTRLFREMGALGADNRVEAITHWREFFGGGMGRKIAIDVTYVQDQGLPTRLFAKFTREFGDPLRELFSPVMDPEVKFALLSRRPGFPLRVPRCMFADYNAEHKTGLLITERIPYGEDGIEPALEKCVDYEMSDPLPYYQAQTRAIAKLAAYHRAGHFGDEVDRIFPFDPHADALLKVIPFDAGELQVKIDKLKAFAARAPQLLPDGLSDPAFLNDFGAGLHQVLSREQAMWRHLYAHRDAIALVHWNMNPDNAWFWRDEKGEMQSGQLDWGGVCQANLVQSYYGMLCAAETDFLAQHDAALRSLLLDEYARRGGPAIDAGAFDADLKIAIALLGTAWMLDAPALLEAEIPDYPQLTGRTDPALRSRFLPRAQLQLLRVFMSEWRRKNIGAAIAAIPA